VSISALSWASRTPVDADELRSSIDENGALMGPWNPWLHEPKFGKPIWELTKALSFSPSLAKPVREVAILVTGAKFRAAYEIYAHVMLAEQRGISDAKIATIVAGQRPNDLAPDDQECPAAFKVFTVSA
jgi:4-carboxymuconolactone decarboxylase